LGESDAVALAAPVPLNPTVCGDPLALSVTVRFPVLLPEAVGLNVTDMVQLAPAATLVPQVFVSAKSPEIVIEEILRAA
jgi:hypothetical protein